MTTCCWCRSAPGFKTKGVDRSLKALAALPSELKKRTRLFVIGQDDPKVFQLQSATLGLGDNVQFLKGRSDIPRFLLGADLLIHPAYNENAGTVLLEALVAGLPVLVSAVCGYAHYIAEADSGLVLDEPFEQAAVEPVPGANVDRFCTARGLGPQWVGLRRDGRPLQHAAARCGCDSGGAKTMKLILAEPFKTLWAGRDASPKSRNCKAGYSVNWQRVARCAPRWMAARIS